MQWEKVSKLEVQESKKSSISGFLVLTQYFILYSFYILVSKDITFEFASCLKIGVDTLHSHGEMITLTGICVDQKCQCVNGRWNCFDYCTPLSELSCPSDEMIIWDPFCCPRCRGKE